MMLRLVFLCVAILVAQDARAQSTKAHDAVKVTKTRDLYTAVFRALEDGTFQTQALTAAEYQALGGVNAAPPPHQNLPRNRTWIFVGASINDEYSTPSGRLEPGNVYETDLDIFVILGDEEESLTLDKKAYVVTDTGGKTLKIVPDPPGFEIKDGEVHKK